MTPGQNRVFVLLLILLALEVVRVPALKAVIHNGYAYVVNALAQGGQAKQ